MIQDFVLHKKYVTSISILSCGEYMGRLPELVTLTEPTDEEIVSYIKKTSRNPETGNYSVNTSVYKLFHYKDFRPSGNDYNDTCECFQDK